MAELQYAFQISRRDGTESITLGNARNIPVFLLSLNQELIHRGLDHFDAGNQEPGDVERKLLEYFLSLLSSQIHEIELYENYPRLSEAMRGNLANLKAYLESQKAG